MAGYSYVAIDMYGKEKKGKMEAPDEERVFQILKSEGLFPVSIKELSVLNKDIKIRITSPVKPRDLSIFTRQFVSILQAGVPIISAMEMLAEQTENKTLKKAIINILHMIEKGDRLADAMRNQGDIFPPIYINMVEAGEASGSLEVALDRMATHFEKEAKLKALMKKALIYPVFLSVIALCVIVLMLVFVVPTFMKMFADMNMEMPAITIAVVNMSNFLLQKWYIVFGVLAAIVVSLMIFKSSKAGKLFLAKLAIKVPIFGNLTIKTASARFTRTLSTLIAAGIPVIDAIEITSRTIDNQVIRKVILDSKEEVARGVPLSVPIKASGVFPPLVYHMTKIGEDTGSLETMLNKIADYYEEEVEVATQSLTAAMEPLIIVIMAVVIGALLLAILQPMFSMYEQLDSAMMGDPGAGL